MHLFDGVGFCQTVFARFNSSRFKGVVGNVKVLNVS